MRNISGLPLLSLFNTDLSPIPIVVHPAVENATNNITLKNPLMVTEPPVSMCIPAHVFADSLAVIVIFRKGELDKLPNSWMLIIDNFAYTDTKFI